MFQCNPTFNFLKEARTLRFSKVATEVLSAGSSFISHKVRNSHGFKK